MSTVLVEPAVPVPRELPSLSSLLTVSVSWSESIWKDADYFADAKQARDLITILTEAKQQIDPRLAEMARYSGGGGGHGGYGRWGGRGGGRGGRGRGGHFTASNAAPIGGNRRW